jgi:hypothetical protein
MAGKLRDKSRFIDQLIQYITDYICKRVVLKISAKENKKDN